MSDDDPIFFKQRRNLILISSLILFYELGEISSNGAVHLPMIEAKINQPAAINAFLHALLLYFLWRYYTLFRIVNGSRLIWSNSHNKVKNCMYHKAQTIALKLLKGKIRDGFGVGTNRDPIPLDNKSRDFTTGGAEYRFTYTATDGKSALLETPIQIKGWQLVFIKIKVYIKDFILQSLFLEYYFPFVICAAAFLESFDIGYGRQVIHYLDW